MGPLLPESDPAWGRSMARLYTWFAFFGLATVSAAVLMGFRHEPGAPPTNYVFNGVLYAAFMAIHAVMMTSWYKRLTTGAPEGSPKERRIYTVVSVVTWLFVYAIHRPLPGPAVELPGWATFVGFCGVLLGKRLLQRGRVVGDSDQANTGRVKFVGIFIELDHLLHAVGAPVEGAAGHQHQAVGSGKLLDQADGLTLVQRIDARKARADGGTGVKVVGIRIDEHAFRDLVIGRLLEWLLENHHGEGEQRESSGGNNQKLFHYPVPQKSIGTDSNTLRKFREHVTAMPRGEDLD